MFFFPRLTGWEPSQIAGYSVIFCHQSRVKTRVDSSYKSTHHKEVQQKQQGKKKKRREKSITERYQRSSTCNTIYFSKSFTLTTVTSFLLEWGEHVDTLSFPLELKIHYYPLLFLAFQKCWAGGLKAQRT